MVLQQGDAAGMFCSTAGLPDCSGQSVTGDFGGFGLQAWCDDAHHWDTEPWPCQVEGIRNDPALGQQVGDGFHRVAGEVCRRGGCLVCWLQK
ncbi:MAG: hypothetical protein QOF70_5851, partial [Acetobacteraceae bacterium]|nr:hypothetical protein [Acetobacteraceae bacterium]